MAEVTIIEQCPDCGCTTLDQINYNFCGSDTVESEICFIPGVAPGDITSVTVSCDPADFAVELVCCNLIVVCGKITKTIIFTDSQGGTSTKIKDILVQVKVPAEICNPIYLDPANWLVTGVQVCTGCWTLTCVDKADVTKFHKFLEKDILSVQVDSN